MFSKLMSMVIVAALLSLTGCGSSPSANAAKDEAAKSFIAKSNKSNIYVYRNESMKAALKLPIVLNGKTVGDTAGKTYMLLEVPPGKHTLASVSENNSLLPIITAPGQNYFVWQEVKMGQRAPRTYLQLVDQGTGRAGVKECKLLEYADK